MVPATGTVLAVLKAMQGRRVRNYALPGLDSILLSNGQVRMFESCRETKELITPHTHRYDFACYVLRGTVWNTLYTLYTHSAQLGGRGDLWRRDEIVGGIGMGDYVTKPGPFEIYESKTYKFDEGDWYAMRHDDIHSIRFSAGTHVLFFEGPDVQTKSHILIPTGSDGEPCENFTSPEWMFKKGPCP